jgi:hypothetical protein
MTLEILNFLLVLDCGSFRTESSQVPALSGFWIFLAGIEPILAGA